MIKEKKDIDFIMLNLPKYNSYVLYNKILPSGDTGLLTYLIKKEDFKKLDGKENLRMVDSNDTIEYLKIEKDNNFDFLKTFIEIENEKVVNKYLSKLLKLYGVSARYILENYLIDAINRNNDKSVDKITGACAKLLMQELSESNHLHEDVKDVLISLSIVRNRDNILNNLIEPIKNDIKSKKYLVEIFKEESQALNFTINPQTLEEWNVEVDKEEKVIELEYENLHALRVKMSLEQQIKLYDKRTNNKSDSETKMNLIFEGIAAGLERGSAEININDDNELICIFYSSKEIDGKELMITINKVIEKFKDVDIFDMMKTSKEIILSIMIDEKISESEIERKKRKI